MTTTNVIIPDFETRVYSADSKQEIIEIIDSAILALGGKVTLKMLGKVDSFYTTYAGQIAWENIRTKKAGFLPHRRAALALGKLIADSQ